MQDTLQTDILVIGSGLAGLAAAWDAAKRGCQVTLLTRAENPEESNTDRAQGGIIYRSPAESPDQLVADILSVGGGLSSPEAARLLSREGPRLVKEILIDELGVPFDVSKNDSSAENPAQRQRAVGMEPLHKFLAVTIHQTASLAAYRLGNQEAAVGRQQRGRVESTRRC